MKDEHLYISLKTYKILAAGMLVGLGLLMCLVVISLVISVFLKHPIYSLLMLIFSFFLIAILMLISGIEYLAALILLIYAGAISILLLFVLMMFDMKELYLFDYFDKQVSKSQIIKFFLAGFIIIFFIVGYVYLACYYFPVVVMNMYDNDWSMRVDWASVFQQTSDVRAIGFVIYRYLFFIPIFVALMVLVTLVGCLALVSQLNKGAKTQVVSIQTGAKKLLELK